LLPEALVPLLFFLLPPFEIALGVCVMPLISSALAGFPFLLFGATVARGLLGDRDNPACGCFGGQDGRISWRLVAPNLALALTAPALETSNKSSEVSEAAFALSGSLVITQWLWVTRQEYNSHFERQKL
jgi:hypothetical protein